MDRLATTYIELYSNLGAVENWKKLPMCVPPPPPPPPLEPKAPMTTTSASAAADEVWEDAGANELRPPVVKCPVIPMTQWRCKKGTFAASVPWSLRIPLPFIQAFDLGSPAAGWVTKLQQALHSL